MNMQGLLGEWTTRDAAATVSRREENEIGSSKSAIMGEVGSVTAHACVTAIKQRRLRQIICVVEPIPVWLVTLIAAFFAKRCLVGICYVSVPGQKVALMSDINMICELPRISKAR